MANKTFDTVGIHLTAVFQAVHTPAATKQFAGDIIIVPAQDGLDIDIDIRLVINSVNLQRATKNRVVSGGQIKFPLKIQKSDSVQAKVRGYVEEAVTAITKANPAVVTMATNAILEGQQIVMDGGDMTEIPLGVYKAVNVTATTFELQTEDGVNINSTAYTVYTTGGQVALHLADALVVGYEETEPT